MNTEHPNCTHKLRAAGQYYPRTCAECGLGPCKVQHAPLAEPEIIKAPATAAPAESIASPEFQSLMLQWASDWCRELRRDNAIAFIDAWGAQRYEAGRDSMQPTINRLAAERSTAVDELCTWKERAERAEAALEEWTHTNKVDELGREVDRLRADLKAEQERGFRANSTIERYWGQIIELQNALASRPAVDLSTLWTATVDQVKRGHIQGDEVELCRVSDVQALLSCKVKAPAQCEGIVLRRGDYRLCSITGNTVSFEAQEDRQPEPDKTIPGVFTNADDLIASVLSTEASNTVMPVMPRRIVEKCCFIQCPPERCDCKNGNPLEWEMQQGIFKQPEAPTASPAAADVDGSNSGCRMTGGICACTSGGSFGGCARERSYCCTNEPARPASTAADAQTTASADGLPPLPKPEFVLHPNRVGVASIDYFHSSQVQAYASQARADALEEAAKMFEKLIKDQISEAGMLAAIRALNKQAVARSAAPAGEPVADRNSLEFVHGALMAAQPKNLGKEAWDRHERAINVIGCMLNQPAAPVANAGMSFDEAWENIDWDKWRNVPIKELVRCLHGVTSPAQAAQPAEPCQICGSDEPKTGTCGSADPRALCNAPPAGDERAALAALVHAIDNFDIDEPEVSKALNEARAAIAAQQPAQADDARDAARLNYLEAMTVNVRVPLRHGSRDLFWASPSDDDGDAGPSDIRAKIDAAIAAQKGAES